MASRARHCRAAAAGETLDLTVVGRSARSGIWHETYLVQAGEYGAISIDMR